MNSFKEAISSNLYNKLEMAASTAPSLFDLCDRAIQKMSMDYQRTADSADLRIRQRKASKRAVVPLDSWQHLSLVQQANTISSKVRNKAMKYGMLARGGRKLSSQVGH